METYIILTIILLTAVWNGLVIQWYNTKEHRYSKLWHGVGFIIRAMLVLLVWLETNNYYWTGAAAVTCWLPYNAIINLCMGQSVFYIGQTSAIDKLLRKLWKQ